MTARVSVRRQIAAYTLLQVAALSILVPWGFVASVALMIAAIWVAAIPFFSFTSLRDFVVATIVLIAVLGGMFVGTEVLLHLGYRRAAQILVVAFPVAIGAIGIRQALRTREATRTI
jgi:hypothetical protein